MDDKKTLVTEENLVKDLQQLTNSVEKLTTIVSRIEDKKYLQMIAHPKKFLTYSFLHGAFIALGSTIGVVIVFTVIAYVLKMMQYLPLVGDFSKNILPLLHK